MQLDVRHEPHVGTQIWKFSDDLSLNCLFNAECLLYILQIRWEWQTGKVCSEPVKVEESGAVCRFILVELPENILFKPRIFRIPPSMTRRTNNNGAEIHLARP